MTVIFRYQQGISWMSNYQPLWQCNVYWNLLHLDYFSKSAVCVCGAYIHLH